MNVLSAEAMNLAVIRMRHHNGPHRDDQFCNNCGEDWKCTAIRLADEVERLRGEVQRYTILDYSDSPRPVVVACWDCGGTEGVSVYFKQLICGQCYDQRIAKGWKRG